MSGIALDYGALRAGLESVLSDAGLSFTRALEETSGTEFCRTSISYGAPKRGPIDRLRILSGRFMVDVRRDRWADPAALESAAFSVLKLFYPLDRTLEGGAIVRSAAIGSIAAESSDWVYARVTVGWDVHLLDGTVHVPTVSPQRDFPDMTLFDPQFLRSDLEGLLPTTFPVSSSYALEQPSGPHIRTFISRDPNSQVMRAVERQSGVFFVLFHAPSGDGVLHGEQIADTIRQAYMPFDQTLPSGATIRNAYLGESYAGDGGNGAGGPAWTVHPVFVEWRQDIVRESSNG